MRKLCPINVALNSFYDFFSKFVSEYCLNPEI